MLRRRPPTLKPAIIIALALSVSTAALAASSRDHMAAVFKGCKIWDQGEVTDRQVACLRSAAGKAERDMNTAYRGRIQITEESARARLKSVQRLWEQSTRANCEYFVGNPGSAAGYICLIDAIIQRKQTLGALD